MRIISKEIKNHDGTIDRVIARTDDSYNVTLANNYSLANRYSKKEVFKNSLLGADIGIHSYGFASIAIIASIIAISVFLVLLLLFRI